MVFTMRSVGQLPGYRENLSTNKKGTGGQNHLSPRSFLSIGVFHPESPVPFRFAADAAAILAVVPRDLSVPE